PGPGHHLIAPATAKPPRSKMVSGASASAAARRPARPGTSTVPRSMPGSSRRDVAGIPPHQRRGLAYPARQGDMQPIRVAHTSTQADEWALVLTAAGIPHAVAMDDGGWTVLVDTDAA